MGVPAHDARDYEFAKKYNLSIKQVIETQNNETPNTETGILINSENFDGLSSEDASKKIINRLIELNSGEELIQFRLRDWGVSRQRYWGCPIPVVYENGSPKVVDESDMPIKLPKLSKDSQPTPLSQNSEFITINEHSTRESDTFDTFMDSSWYLSLIHI